MVEEDISRLPFADKERLYRKLGDMISRERNIEKARKNTELRKLAEEIKGKVLDEMGITDYSSKSREHRNVIARIIIANVLIRRGYTGYGIGVVLNKKHSSVDHYRLLLNDWLDFPQYYEEELAIWHKISKQYETE